MNSHMSPEELKRLGYHGIPSSLDHTSIPDEVRTASLIKQNIGCSKQSYLPRKEAADSLRSKQFHSNQDSSNFNNQLLDVINEKGHTSHQKLLSRNFNTRQVLNTEHLLQNQRDLSDSPCSGEKQPLTSRKKSRSSPNRMSLVSILGQSKTTSASNVSPKSKQLIQNKKQLQVLANQYLSQKSATPQYILSQTPKTNKFDTLNRKGSPFNKSKKPTKQYYSILKQQQDQSESHQPQKDQEDEIISLLRIQIQNIHDQNDVNKLMNKLQPITQGVFDNINYQQLSLIMYQAMQSMNLLISKKQKSISDLQQQLQQIQQQQQEFPNQIKSLQQQIIELEQQVLQQEASWKQQFLEIQFEKQTILEKLKNQVELNQAQTIRHEAYVNELRRKFLQSFEQRLQDLQSQNEQELQNTTNKYEKEIQIFKKQCEEFIKEKIAHYVQQEERLKQLLTKAQIKIVEEIYPESRANLTELEIVLEGLIHLLKRRDIEIFDLTSKYQLEIERANLIEIEKLEIEQKANHIRQVISANTEKLYQEIVANSSNSDIVLGKLEGFIAFLKKNLALIVK